VLLATKETQVPQAPLERQDLQGLKDFRGSPEKQA
jgi:hypothetical protein